jgi:dienelactone hydrolase
MSTRAARIMALTCALTIASTACGTGAKRVKPPPASAATTTAPATPTTLGTLPRTDPKGLRIRTATAPPGVVAPGATWLRLERADHAVQLAAVYRPRTPGRHPVVVYLHGSSGLAETELAWGRALAAKGYIVVAGCYFDVDPGASKPTPHFWVPCPGVPNEQESAPPATAAAYKALVAVAAALPDAAPGRLGVVGVSYGAILALGIAEPRVKVIVADSGAGKAGPGPVHAPVLLLGMQTDPNEPHALLTAFELALRAAHKTVESHYYAGTGHVVTLTSGAVGGDATTRAVSFLRRAIG